MTETPNPGGRLFSRRRFLAGSSPVGAAALTPKALPFVETALRIGEHAWQAYWEEKDAQRRANVSNEK